MSTSVPRVSPVPAAVARTPKVPELLLAGAALAGLAVAIVLLVSPDALLRLLRVPAADATQATTRALARIVILSWGAGFAAAAAGLTVPGLRVRLAGWMRGRGALWSLLGLHVLSTLLLLGPGDWVRSQPITTCDHPVHVYQVAAAHAILGESHRAWGYDPFFMAGYPAGVIFDLDMKGAELFVHLLSPLGVARAFKLYVFLCLILFPVVVYGASRALRLDRTEALVAVVLGLVFWHWGRPELGHFRWAGMHSFVLASYLALLDLAWFRRALTCEPRRRGRAVLGVMLAVAVTCHVHALAVVILFPGLVTLYVARARRLRRRDHAMLGLAAGGVALLNADWIVPFLAFRGDKTASNLFWQLRGVQDLVGVYLRTTSVVLAGITLAGLWGLTRWVRRDAVTGAAFVASAGFLAAAAFFGASLGPLSHTEPGRYLVPFAFFMVLPAALAVTALARREAHRGRALMPAVLLVLASSVPLLAFADARGFYVHRLQATLPEPFVRLVATLQARTHDGARILFETPGDVQHPSPLLHGGHLQALVPWITGRQVIGGPYPTSFLRHARVDFENGRLLERSLADWDPRDLRAFLRRYNVGWIACRSEIARRAFGAPELGLVRGDTLDGYTLWEVPDPPGFADPPARRVRADYDRITVEGAAGGDVVLRFHWLPTLGTEPPLALEREPVPGDPVGFIRVHAGSTPDFAVVNQGVLSRLTGSKRAVK